MDAFLLPSSLKVVDIQDTPARFIVMVEDTRVHVCCPSCGQPSRRLHSHYQRVAQDTALGDRAVEVHLRVRRLRCDTIDCRQLTFAETWPEWLDARVQRTARLAQVQRSVAMALGGEAGKRLLTLLHEGTSGDTLLRLIRTQPVPEHPPPRVLGVDDFCFKRGKTYGTLLIDLEQHQVVDVLPDRLAATLAAWLTVHPGIEIISRDRYGDYARGAATGAPNAQQIADRFHLLKNLRDVAESWLKRHRAHLVFPKPDVVSDVPSPEDAPPVPVPMNATVRRLTAVLDLRAARLARYEQSMALHAEGHSIRAVAGLTGTSRTVISRWIKAGRFPGRASVLAGVAPFLDIIRERALEQEWTGKQIIEEVVALGYTGPPNGVYELLRWMSIGHLLPSIEDQQGTASPAPQAHRYSAKQGAWLFIQAPEKLKERDQQRLALLHDTVEASRTVYTLVQEFAQLLRVQSHDASERLTAWLLRTRVSTQGFMATATKALEEGIEIPRSRGPSCEVSMPRSSSLPLSIVSALLNRATSVSGIASYSTVRKSRLCQSLAQQSFTTNQDLQRRAKNAPQGAFLAIDFVMVPHAGLEMEGLNFHYSGQARTQLGHQFTSAALVKFGADPTPLLERFKVSRLLETAAYPYRTATQEMIYTVTQCREAGVSIAGVLLDGEFGRDEVVTFSHDTQIPVLVRAKRNMSVEVEGECLTLNALAERFPPERCHLYAEFAWRVRRLPVSRAVGAFDVLIVWRKVHGEWSCFFLFSTFDPALTVRTLLRAWKARWGIEVIHRLMKQNFALGRCRCRTIQAQDNWAWCVVEALHAVLLVRQEQPQLTWRAAQRRAAQHTELYVLTEVQPVSQHLHAA